MQTLLFQVYAAVCTLGSADCEHRWRLCPKKFRPSRASGKGVAGWSGTSVCHLATLQKNRDAPAVISLNLTRSDICIAAFESSSPQPWENYSEHCLTMFFQQW